MIYFQNYVFCGDEAIGQKQESLAIAMLVFDFRIMKQANNLIFCAIAQRYDRKLLDLAGDRRRLS
jgi:hypothetical protein